MFYYHIIVYIITYLFKINTSYCFFRLFLNINNEINVGGINIHNAILFISTVTLLSSVIAIDIRSVIINTSNVGITLGGFNGIYILQTIFLFLPKIEMMHILNLYSFE